MKDDNEEKINGYSLSRQWFDFIEGTKEMVTPLHTSLYLWIVELNNRLQWCPVVGLPTDRTMRMCRIKSYKWYKRTLDDLIRWGFINLIRKSFNQYTCNEVALVLQTKAVSKQIPEQLPHNKTDKTDKTDKIKKPDKPATPNLDFISSVIAEFKKVFPEYIITAPGKERKMAGKLVVLWRNKYPDLKTHEILKSLHDYFEQCKNISDDWHKNKMSLGHMVSQYNEIQNIFKNPKKKNINPGSVDITNQDLSKKWN